MTITPDQLRDAANKLSAAGLDEPMREARVLANNAPDAATFESYVHRRAQREPAAYILGRKEFWSLEFEVTPAVLIPRPETETLVEAALGELANHPPRRILDLGSGSGAILLALLSEWKVTTGVGLDASVEAIAIARRNAQKLHMEHRAAFELGDFARPPAERFDLVVSNPPYVADAELMTLDPDVRDYEPRLALAAGIDGLDAVRTIAHVLPQLLNPGAPAFIEIGHAHGEVARLTLTAAGLRVERIVKDLAGCDRVIVARVPQ